jgi:hypothetical protein
MEPTFTLVRYLPMVGSASGRRVLQRPRGPTRRRQAIRLIHAVAVGRPARPEALIVGASSYPGVDATQGQRALLDRHAVQFFNRRSHRKRNAWGRA